MADMLGCWPSGGFCWLIFLAVVALAARHAHDAADTSNSGGWGRPDLHIIRQGERHCHMRRRAWVDKRGVRAVPPMET